MERNSQINQQYQQTNELYQLQQQSSMNLRFLSEHQFYTAKGFESILSTMIQQLSNNQELPNPYCIFIQY